MSSVSEARRFISLLQCLPRIARQLVRQTPEYPQGQLKVLPLLLAVLPGIDWNDFEKTTATLDFLETILSLISCVDCSSAVNERTDLTEIEKEVCLLTAMFGEFIEKFFDRIFGLIQILSAECSEALTVSEDPKDCRTLQIKLTSIVQYIVEQCSDDILQVSIERLRQKSEGKCVGGVLSDFLEIVDKNMRFSGNFRRNPTLIAISHEKSPKLANLSNFIAR